MFLIFFSVGTVYISIIYKHTQMAPSVSLCDSEKRNWERNNFSLIYLGQKYSGSFLYHRILDFMWSYWSLSKVTIRLFIGLCIWLYRTIRIIKNSFRNDFMDTVQVELDELNTIINLKIHMNSSQSNWTNLCVRLWANGSRWIWL
jgi:hypothetical protein